MEIEIKHFKFKHPFTCLIAGPTGSGKTFLLRRILKHHNKLISNVTSPIKVLWAYGQWQSLYSVPISSNVIVNYHDGLPSQASIQEFNPEIIILDDLMNQFDKNKDLENLFIKQSHHLNISVIFAVQNLFYKTVRTISLNTQYLILMKSPRDAQQILNLARQIFPNNPKFLTEAYNDATKQAYGYIKIDLTPDTPEQFRVQTRFTPEEVEHLNKEFAPIVYKPKNV